MTPPRPRRLDRAGTGGPAAPDLAAVRDLIDRGDGKPAAPAPEPIAEERIEWGHVWADPERQRRWLIENDGDPIIRTCRTHDRDSDGPCWMKTAAGKPIRHVWRRVITTEWQDRQP